MFEIDDKIQWVSAAGTMQGTVVALIKAKNENDEIVDWIEVDFVSSLSSGDQYHAPFRLNATEDYIKMMRMEKVAENV